jgi:DNA-binding XRE family transcriptional regulator
MTAALRRWLPFILVGVASAWMAATISSTGDWPRDAWPAIHALAHGQVGKYLSAEALMGPVSTLVQAPFAAIANGSQLDVYRWASFPCLLAGGLLGLYLAGIARRRGASSLSQVLLAALCLVNPLTVAALENGHPEEILTAALAIAAIASASEGRKGRAALLLGLALASKQWAVIAILPTLMALPGSRVRVGFVAGAIAVLLTVPALIASPDSFAGVHDTAATAPREVGPWSIWYPAATVRTEALPVEQPTLVAHVHETPPLLRGLSRPLIVLLAFAVPLALCLRGRRFSLDGGEAMALMALLALLRSVLDPVNNIYYHEPLLLALIGWDAFSSRGLPLRGLTGAAVALAFRQWALNVPDFTVLNRTYIAVVMVAAIAIAMELNRSIFWVGTDTKSRGNLSFRGMNSKFRGLSVRIDGR